MSRWARSVAPLGVMTLALLGAGQTAQAGKWKVTLMNAHGKSIFPPESEFNPGDDGRGRAEEFPGGYDWIGDVGAEGSYGSAGTYSGYQVTSTKAGAVVERTESGSVVATFEWDDDDGHNGHDGSPVPEWLFVRLGVTADAHVDSHGGSGSGDFMSLDDISVRASNGLETATPSTSLSDGGKAAHGEAYINTVRIIPIQSHGQKIVTMNLPAMDIMAKGTNPSTNTGWQVVVATNPSYGVAPTNRGVGISSDIETSYRKVTDQTALPLIHDVSGNTNGTIDTSKIKTSTPWDGLGPWAVAIERNSAAPMTVESAASWDPVTSNPPEWIASATFTAHAAGFTNPHYEWVAPGIIGNNTTPPPGYTAPPTISSPDAPSLAIDNIHLQGDKLGAGMIRSSNVKVVVTDTNGTLDDSYNINWHVPYENFEHIGSKANADHDLIEASDIDPNEKAFKDGQFTTSRFNLGRFAWLGDYIDGAAQGLSLLSSASFESPHTSLILAGMGVALSQVDPAEDLITAIPNSQDAWNESVSLNRVPTGAAWDDCWMVKPYLSVYYDEHYYQFDNFDRNGYSGRLKKAKKVLRAQNPIVYAGDYELLPTKP